MTIPRTSTKGDPGALALAALGWILADDTRAERLLSLTGLTPDTLREQLGDQARQIEVLGAVLDFLDAHEPDLLAAADALAVTPTALIAARDELTGNARATPRDDWTTPRDDWATPRDDWATPRSDWKGAT